MPAYRIKRVDGTDEEIADTLKWMNEVCFATSAPAAEPDYGYWWITYLDKEPCAFAALSEATLTPGLGYLKRVGVFKQHRGNGLQLKLIRVREALARKLGWGHMITDTTNNPASSNTLIRAGYRLFTPASPWAWDYSLYWEKKL